jgi:phosphatidylserine/phosphatidylglycerophosphate/cardiolipin synthase-like enzyme
VSDEYTSDVVRFRVALADSRDGPRNRIVIYDWFVRGEDRAPPRGGHAVELLIDGEQTWARLAADLEAASEEIQIATWMARPDLELRRPESLAVSEPRERGHLRLGAVLERRASEGVAVHLLIWGMVYTPILDRWMRRWYWRGCNNIDVLEQDHPHLLGAIHQKTITIDGRIGYCGGMNLKQNDWDTPTHCVFEPRRFPFSAGVARRRRTAHRRRRAAYLPRHDLKIRIEGPAVADLVDCFTRRWAKSVQARRDSWFGRLVDWVRRKLGNQPYPALPGPKRVPERCGEAWVQVVRTSPKGEDGILDAYVRAIRNARRFIYIENQYFRSPLIGEVLRDALRDNPRLRLAVVVRPVNDGRRSIFDPRGYWTAQTLALVREARPEFELSRLIVHAADRRGRRIWQDVDLHSKLMIVDDLWLTIGSANINERGFRTDGEINVVVVDEPLATQLRTRLMAEHLELPLSDPRLADADRAFDLWAEHGRENPRLRAQGLEPRSRVHHFVQRAVSWPPFGVHSGIF